MLYFAIVPYFICFLFLIINFVIISADRQLDYSPEKVLRIEDGLEHFWNDFFDQLDGIALPNGVQGLWTKVRPEVTSKVSENCLESIDSLLDNWRSKESSSRLLFSTGSSLLPAGFLTQTTVELGDFDQCLGTADERSKWIGQYCVGTLNIPRSRLFSPTNLTTALTSQPVWRGELLQAWYSFDNHYSLARGFCSPSTCDAPELQTILQQSFPVLNSLDFRVQFCQTSTHQPRHPRVWIPATIFGISILLVLVGTLYSAFVPTRKDSKIDDAVRAFDLVNNAQRLANVNPEMATDRARFRCFHGFRALLSIMVIVVHTLMYGPTTQIKILAVNHFPTITQEYIRKGFGQLAANLQTALSVFMIMSSILLSFTELRKGPLRENFLMYLAGRWARYMPAYIGCVCFYLLWQFTGSGPLYHEDNLSSLTGSCYEYWWRHLLMIHNFFDFGDMCIQPSWFIATEFQLRIISFLLFILYARYSARWTIIGAVSLAVIGVLTRIGIMLKLNLIANIYSQIFSEYPYNHHYVSMTFTSLFTFMETYMIGFVIGLWLLEKRHFRFTIGRSILFALLGAWAVGYEGWKFHWALVENKLVVHNPPLVDTVSVNLSFVLFNLFVGYFLYYLIQHPGSVFSSFLSHPLFLPLSRLTFCVYLIHDPIIVHMNAQVRSPLSFDNNTLVARQLIANILESFLTAILVHLLFEAPWDTVLRIFRPKKPEVTEKEMKSGEQTVELMQNNNQHA